MADGFRAGQRTFVDKNKDSSVKNDRKTCAAQRGCREVPVESVESANGDGNSAKSAENSDRSGALCIGSTVQLLNVEGIMLLEEQKNKKRCADRYDSSESSDSGVAALSCTESSSGGSSSDDNGGLLDLLVPYSPESGCEEIQEENPTENIVENRTRIEKDSVQVIGDGYRDEFGDGNADSRVSVSGNRENRIVVGENGDTVLNNDGKSIGLGNKNLAVINSDTGRSENCGNRPGNRDNCTSVGNSVSKLGKQDNCRGVDGNTENAGPGNTDENCGSDAIVNNVTSRSENRGSGLRSNRENRTAVGHSKDDILISSYQENQLVVGLNDDAVDNVKNRKFRENKTIVNENEVNTNDNVTNRIGNVENRRNVEQIDTLSNVKNQENLGSIKENTRNEMKKDSMGLVCQNTPANFAQLVHAPILMSGVKNCENITKIGVGGQNSGVSGQNSGNTSGNTSQISGICGRNIGNTGQNSCNTSQNGGNTSYNSGNTSQNSGNTSQNGGNTSQNIGIGIHNGISSQNVGTSGQNDGISVQNVGITSQNIGVIGTNNGITGVGGKNNLAKTGIVQKNISNIKNFEHNPKNIETSNNTNFDKPSLPKIPNENLIDNNTMMINKNSFDSTMVTKTGIVNGAALSVNSNGLICNMNSGGYTGTFILNNCPNNFLQIASKSFSNGIVNSPMVNGHMVNAARVNGAIVNPTMVNNGVVNGMVNGIINGTTMSSIVNNHMICNTPLNNLIKTTIMNNSLKFNPTSILTMNNGTVDCSSNHLNQSSNVANHMIGLNHSMISASNQSSNQMSNRLNQSSNQLNNQTNNQTSNQLSKQLSNQIGNQSSNHLNPSNNHLMISTSNQSSNQTSNQLSNQTSNQLSNQTSNYTCNQFGNQSSSQFSNQASNYLNQSSNQTNHTIGLNHSMISTSNQSSNQSSNQASNQSSYQSSNQLSNQSSNQLSNQSSNQSSNQLSNCSGNMGTMDKPTMNENVSSGQSNETRLKMKRASSENIKDLQNSNNGQTVPCPAKRPRPTCTTEQQRHNTRAAQHCCPNNQNNQHNNQNNQHNNQQNNQPTTINNNTNKTMETRTIQKQPNHNVQTTMKKKLQDNNHHKIGKIDNQKCNNHIDNHVDNQVNNHVNNQKINNVDNGVNNQNTNNRGDNQVNNQKTNNVDNHINNQNIIVGKPTKTGIGKLNNGTTNHTNKRVGSVNKSVKNNQKNMVVDSDQRDIVDSQQNVGKNTQKIVEENQNLVGKNSQMVNTLSSNNLGVLNRSKGEITTYFKQQTKSLRRCDIANNTKGLVGDYLTLLTAKTASSAVLLEKRSYDVRTLTLTTPPAAAIAISNNNNNTKTNSMTIKTNIAPKNNSITVKNNSITVKNNSITTKTNSITSINNCNNSITTKNNSITTKNNSITTKTNYSNSITTKNNPITPINNCNNTITSKNNRVQRKIHRRPVNIAPRVTKRGITNIAPKNTNTNNTTTNGIPNGIPEIPQATVLLTTIRLPTQQNSQMVTKIPTGLILNGFQQSQPMFLANQQMFVPQRFFLQPMNYQTQFQHCPPLQQHFNNVNSETPKIDDMKIEEKLVDATENIEESPKSLVLERIQQTCELVTSDLNELSNETSNETKSVTDSVSEVTERIEPRVIRFPANKSRDENTRRSRENNSTGRCVWDDCRGSFDTTTALLEHLQSDHVIPQQGPYRCLWSGCKVYSRESSSRHWLERHVSGHGGTKTLKCIVAGCRDRFSSQLALQRHVNNHFNSETSTGSSKKSQDNTPNSAALKLIRRNGKKLRYRRQPWSARMFDFFDLGAMEGLQHRLLSTESVANGPAGSVTLQAECIARRNNSTGQREVLVTWTPKDIIPDEWIPEEKYTRTKNVDIRTLSNDSKCELSSQISTRPHQSSTRKHSRKYRKPHGNGNHLDETKHQNGITESLLEKIHPFGNIEKKNGLC